MPSPGLPAVPRLNCGPGGSFVVHHVEVSYRRCIFRVIVTRLMINQKFCFWGFVSSSTNSLTALSAGVCCPHLNSYMLKYAFRLLCSSPAVPPYSVQKSRDNHMHFPPWFRTASISPHGQKSSPRLFLRTTASSPSPRRPLQRSPRLHSHRSRRARQRNSAAAVNFKRLNRCGTARRRDKDWFQRCGLN